MMMPCHRPTSRYGRQTLDLDPCASSLPVPLTLYSLPPLFSVVAALAVSAASPAQLLRRGLRSEASASPSTVHRPLLLCRPPCATYVGHAIAAASRQPSRGGEDDPDDNAGGRACGGLCSRPATAGRPRLIPADARKGDAGPEPVLALRGSGQRRETGGSEEASLGGPVCCGAAGCSSCRGNEQAGASGDTRCARGWSSTAGTA